MRFVPLFVLVVVMAASCSSTPVEQAGAPAPPPPPVEPEATAAAEAEVASLSDLAATYDLLDRQQVKTNKQIADLLARYQKRGGSLPPGFGPDLTDEQRALLAERIKTERTGLRAVLQDIIDRDHQLTELRSRSQEIAGRLPEHVVAKEGDRHDRLVMDFLLKHGVSADRAYQLVSQVNLQDALVPGFRVWTLYQNGQFGTWVTGGSADITPQEHQRRLTEMLKSERNQALTTLARTKEDLDDTRNIARQSEAALVRTNEDLAAMARLAERERAENLRREEESAKRTAVENTIRYVVGAKSQLVSEKLIDRSLKLRTLDSPRAQTLMLLQQADIAIDGSAFNLKRLKKVTLVPEVFISGVDYDVNIDGPFARLHLRTIDKFKVTRFVVVVLE